MSFTAAGCLQRFTRRAFHSAANSAMPSLTVAHAAPAATTATTAAPSVVFPPSKRLLDRIAAENLKKNPPPKAPKAPSTHEPRHFKLRASPKFEVAAAPVRDGTKVNWKIARSISGHLPVSLERGPEETAKRFIRIENVSGDVASLVAEIQLFVGPYYTVNTNSVNTVIEVHSTPKSKAGEFFLQKFKKWLIQIGI